MKYTVGVSRRAPDTFSLWLNGSRVDAVARRLNDGGLLVQVQSPALLFTHLKKCRCQTLWVACVMTAHLSRLYLQVDKHACMVLQAHGRKKG